MNKRSAGDDNGVLVVAKNKKAPAGFREGLAYGVIRERAPLVHPDRHGVNLIIPIKGIIAKSLKSLSNLRYPRRDSAFRRTYSLITRASVIMSNTASAKSQIDQCSIRRMPMNPIKPVRTTKAGMKIQLFSSSRL